MNAKFLWTRKAAVDEKIASDGFLDLPDLEQDAWVISLQLDIAFELALRCVDGSATESEVSRVRALIAEAFACGKRAALRSLRTAVAHHPTLRD